MFFRPRRRPATPEPWDRPRLLAMLAAVAAGVLALLVGLGLFIGYAAGTPTPAAPTTITSAPAAVVPVRDRIAAAPMASLPSDAAFTPDPAIAQTGEIRVPVATVPLGPAHVATGFPRTPEGAVGQLAAIEQRVLESMSLPVLREVHQDWVQPGGPPLEAWELTRNVQSFLAAARQGGQEKDLTTLVTVTPAAGMVKGIDGPSWTLACVLLDVQVAIRTDARMGYGLCSRMVWTEGRWQIAPGEPPAPAPQTWPGSKAAAEAGWLTWVDEVAER